ncbi:hypothetical protein [Aneurinibacillus migulanus]|nr:hypothetical protein [Aneurinibacillus migulanus]
MIQEGVGREERAMSGFFDGGVEIIWIILIIVVLVFLFNGFQY